MYSSLMDAACKPYLKMLSGWIYRGVIIDVYDEFMIREQAHLKKVNLFFDGVVILLHYHNRKMLHKITVINIGQAVIYLLNNKFQNFYTNFKI